MLPLMGQDKTNIAGVVPVHPSIHLFYLPIYLSIYLPTHLCEHPLGECALLRPTLCYPKDYSPPGFSIHGTFQARILE